MNQHDPADAGADRLIFLADALKLVPFSEITTRDASATRMIDSRARRRFIANIFRGRKPACRKEARDDDQ